jgi:hypothetical protein
MANSRGKSDQTLPVRRICLVVSLPSLCGHGPCPGRWVVSKSCSCAKVFAIFGLLLLSALLAIGTPGQSLIAGDITGTVTDPVGRLLWERR